MALALAFPSAGCATLGGVDVSAAAAHSSRASLVDRLRERVSAIINTDGFPLLSGWTEERGYARDLLGRALAMLWTSATFRDLPGGIRRSPEVQGWMKERAPDIAHTVFALTEMLEGLSPVERDEFGALLEEVDLEEGVMRGFETHASGRGVEGARVRQTGRLFRHSIWRARTQSLSAVIDDYVARVDKVCRRRRVSRHEDWRGRLADETAILESLSRVDEHHAAQLEAGELSPADLTALDDMGLAGQHLGISMRARTKGEGVLISAVHPGSPAAMAGLGRGDVILAVDGRTLTPPELVVYLAGRSDEPGPVRLHVERGRERLQLPVVPAEGPGDRIVLRSAAPGSVRFGLALMSVGSGVAGVGLAIAGVGGLVFFIGLVVGFADFSAGSVLTIAGGVIVAIGLLIALVGAIATLGGGSVGRTKPVSGSEQTGTVVTRGMTRREMDTVMQENGQREAVNSGRWPSATVYGQGRIRVLTSGSGRASAIRFVQGPPISAPAGIPNPDWLLIVGKPISEAEAIVGPPGSIAGQQWRYDRGRTRVNIVNGVVHNVLCEL